MSETVGRITFSLGGHKMELSASDLTIALPSSYDRLVEAARDVVHHWDKMGAAEACEAAIARLRSELERFPV